MGHRLRYSTGSVDLLHLTVIHRVENDVWRELNCFLAVSDISPQPPAQATDYVLNGILLIKDIFKRSRRCQIFNITHSRWATFATVITPPIPLFFDPVCFLFHPLNIPPPDSPQSPSLWPMLFYPHRVQTITLEPNSSLFPSRAVLSLIFNKKKRRKI